MIVLAEMNEMAFFHLNDHNRDRVFAEFSIQQFLRIFLCVCHNQRANAVLGDGHVDQPSVTV